MLCSYFVSPDIVVVCCQPTLPDTAPVLQQTANECINHDFLQIYRGSQQQATGHTVTATAEDETFFNHYHNIQATITALGSRTTLLNPACCSPTKIVCVLPPVFMDTATPTIKEGTEKDLDSIPNAIHHEPHGMDIWLALTARPSPENELAMELYAGARRIGSVEVRGCLASYFLPVAAQAPSTENSTDATAWFHQPGRNKRTSTKLRSNTHPSSSVNYTHGPVQHHRGISNTTNDARICTVPRSIPTQAPLNTTKYTSNELPKWSGRDV